jgi:uncharacterized protein (TIGR00730 family)
MKIKQVCVFCGSSPGTDPVHIESARAVGRLLARRGVGLVFGGGHVGLMGALADAALEAGGEVTGVIPRALELRELAHRGLTRLHVVATMHERKAHMAQLSDAFLALPGGMGTLDELAEIVTWAQLGLHAKPVGLLDVKGYFAPLVAFFDRAERDGFLRPEHRRLLAVEPDPERMLDRFAAWDPPSVARWLDDDRCA